MADDFDFFEIDQNLLDDEWLAQPKLFFHYAKKLADAKGSFEQAKAELELVCAELDRDIRAEPGTFDLAKLTESTVASTIKLQKEYEVASKQLRKQKHKVDVLQAAVNALDHRKRALEALVSLHGQNYFAAPRAKEEDVTEIVDQQQSRKISKKLDKKRRER